MISEKEIFEAYEKECGDDDLKALIPEHITEEEYIEVVKDSVRYELFKIKYILKQELKIEPTLIKINDWLEKIINKFKKASK